MDTFLYSDLSQPINGATLNFQTSQDLAAKISRVANFLLLPVTTLN